MNKPTGIIKSSPIAAPIQKLTSSNVKKLAKSGKKMGKY